MGVPNPLGINLGGGVGVGGSLGISSLPAIHLNVDSLPAIHLNIDQLAPVHISVDQLPKILLGVDPVEIRLTQFPSIRGHLPADFHVGLSVLGFELMGLRLCGEAMVITEPYQANPCEICGTTNLVQIDVPPAPEAPR
jgi:hypothetical protein